jgi:TolB-like protein/tetratricopeptide (TPR) repeat protein
MTDVFVSYKAEDRARVKPLVDALAAEGLDVWWDLAIAGGARWRETIQTHLDAAACVVVVWSIASVGPAGYFVQDEASHARRRGVYLPVTIDHVDLPLGFGQEQKLDLVNWRGARHDPQFTDVLNAVKALVAQQPPPKLIAGEDALRSAARRRWRLRAAIALVACAIAGLALYVETARPRPCVAGVGCAKDVAAEQPAPPVNSIAVLPLVNLSGDASQDYFSDGLSEELISTLSHVNQLQVIGRTSSFQFKGSKEGAPAIGARLGVAYLLDGTVRRSGHRVRVTAELSDARTGFARWNATYERDVKDVFEVQSGIAGAVAQALKVRFASAELGKSGQDGTDNPNAYDAYLRARGLLQTARGEADDRQALAEYDVAIDADPQFARAYAGRAVALMTIAGNYLEGDELRSANVAALAAAQRAVALAPELATARVALGDVLLNVRLDVAAAGAAYSKAMHLGPGEPNVLIDYGIFRCQIGDCATGLSSLRRALVLDPLNPLAYTNLGRGLLATHRYLEAATAFRHALQLSQGAEEAHAWIGDCLLMLGQTTAAKAEYDREPLAWARLAGQAIVLRRLGDERGAKMAFAELEKDNSTAYQRAQVLAQWGDRDGAFAALDDTIRTNDAGVLYLRMDPLMDSLQRDPRVTVRLEKLGLLGPIEK